MPWGQPNPPGTSQPLSHGSSGAEPGSTLITQGRGSPPESRARLLSVAVHLPSPFFFFKLVLQEELLAWDLSRHRRQVSGYSRGDTSRCRQTVPGKQGGDESTVASLLMRDLGLRESEQDPTAHGALSTCRIPSPLCCSSCSLPGAILSLSMKLGLSRCCLRIKRAPSRATA